MNSPLPVTSARLVVVAGILIQIPWFLDAASLEREYDDSKGRLTLLATPDAGTAVYAVEEQLPDGLSARLVSDEGRYDRFLNKLKWGPFFDDQPRALTCELVTIADTQVTFSGQASWDGSPAQEAAGVNSGIVSTSGFFTWILAELGQAAFFEPGSSAPDDSDRDQTALLEEFVFGMNPSVPDERVLGLSILPDPERVELKLRKRGELENVILGFWQSPDLSTWSTFDPGEAEVLEELGNGLQMVRWAWSSGVVPDFFQLQMTVDEGEN